MAAVLGLLGALAVAEVVPARYRAETVVRAEWASPTDGRDREGEAGLAGRRLQAMRQGILRRSTIETVLREAGPYRSGGGESPPLPQQIERMLDAIGVGSGPAGTYVIEYAHHDPDVAAAVSARLASLLVAEVERARVENAPASAALLEARLAEARQRLEDRLATLRRLQQARDEPTAGSPDRARRDLRAARQAVADDLLAARERAAALERSAGTAAQAPPLDAGAESELKRLVSERAELRRRYTEEHPDVEALTRRIRRLESAAAVAPSPPVPPPAALAEELRKVTARIEALDGKEKELDAELARFESPERAAGVAAASRLGSLEASTREVELAQQEYAALEERWRGAAAAPSLTRASLVQVEILEPARPPERPSSPDPHLFALVGLGLGVVAGVGSALRAERRDPTVRGPEDLRSILPHPLLAVIPEVRTRKS